VISTRTLILRAPNKAMRHSAGPFAVWRRRAASTIGGGCLLGPPCQPTNRSASMHRFILSGTLSLLCAMPEVLAGCDNPKDFTLTGASRKIMGPSPKELVSQAFEDPDPDVRREAIAKLSSHSWGLKEPYLKGYAALLEVEMKRKAPFRYPMLICVAVRALGRSGDAEYLPDLLRAMKDPSDEVRWDAAVALGNVVSEAAVAPLRRAAVSDPSVDVRIACCRALRRYRRQDVVNTLVRCMSDKEFGVQYQAHEMLVELTGRDFGPSAARWAGTDLSKLPPKTTKRGSAWWNPIGWFR